MKFYRNDQIEALAEHRLEQLERELQAPLKPPIPMELFAEKVLDLGILWDRIEELPGETILGAIVPKNRLIILNETHQDLFQQKPGLERSTIGHESGHWDLFVDQSTLDHPVLFSNLQEDGPFALRSSAAGDVAVLKPLLSCAEGQELLAEMESRADDRHEARAVNRYAAAISMPKNLIQDAAHAIDRTKWPNLYDLARAFNVTISALRVRLEQLNLLYVDEDGTLYESRDHKNGQQRLF